MTRFILLSTLGALMMLVFPANRAFAQCGVERWSVKTGTDPDAGLVDLNSMTATTIADLSALIAPSSLPDNHRVQSTETTVWVLDARLKMYVRAFDSDY